MLDFVKKIIEQEANAILSIPLSNPFDQTITCLYEQVHIKKGKVIFSGLGKAGEIARNIATTFCSTGTPAVFLHPVEAQHGDLGILQPEDVMFLVSNSGATREILELIPLAKNLNPTLPTICLTGKLESPLTKMVNIVLWTGAPQEIDPLGLTPTTSTTVMTVIGDILVALMMEKIGFTLEEYGKRHHGGYLGSLCRSINNK
ncbi:MAG: SIS domain-containing protein [Bacteroidia bacterium]|nr:SIS domain-containing protein [Bacteroidia bacterium]MDW8159073.1 SIS domain-containing protein [Bacteroidia bacterium]